MCGIAGILSTSASLELGHFTQRLQQALQHRGPDSQGSFISKSQQAALVHTRLSILDLSAAGHQPMFSADRRYCITFNGEIYNFQALRSQLLQQGFSFESHTDTEVILKLYQQMGADCVHLLRGMFAFAIWDDLTQTCFIARDPLGIKPLYYWSSGGTLVFASELRALLASGLPPVQLSEAGLYGYFTSGSVPEPYTLIEDIYCLPAGSTLQWEAGHITQQQYWEIKFGNVPTSPEDAQQAVRTALIDSVQHHFVSDVPVGIFLSGGIDSTALLALARQTQTGPLQTYSITFEEADWNEGTVARKTAERFETHHTEHCITAAQGQTLLPKFLETLDQPTIDGFNTFCVSQVAHLQGAKVVLSGLGGDELFGGYKSFQKVPQLTQLTKALGPLQPLATLFGQGLEQWGSPQVKRMGDFLQQKPTLSAAYRSFRGIFSHQEAQALVKHYLPQSKASRPDREERDDCFPTAADTVSALELTRYMRNQLLRDSDVMSMAWGLELRVPFVDTQLFESIATIPSPLRLAQGKQLLVQSVPELPEWVLNQPKRGFSFPFQNWLEVEWKEELPCPASIPASTLHPWYRRWCIAMLHHWWSQVTT